MVSYPGGKEDPIYRVPQKVQKFEQQSFYSCQHLREVRISDGANGGKLPQIRFSTFVKCPKLAAITFGNHCFEIGKRFLSKQEPGAWKMFLRAYESDGWILLCYGDKGYSLECKEWDYTTKRVTQQKTWIYLT